MFKPLKEVLGENTKNQYEKKGVRVDALNGTIYPMGLVWMPTSQKYLKHYIEIVQSLQAGKQYKVLDLGCGSGVLSFIFAKNHKKSQVAALDKNPDAVNTTNVNAAKLGLPNVQAVKFDLKDHKKF